MNLLEQALGAAKAYNNFKKEVPSYKTRMRPGGTSEIVLEYMKRNTKELESTAITRALQRRQRKLDDPVIINQPLVRNALYRLVRRDEIHLVRMITRKNSRIMVVKYGKRPATK
jgi:hypothetical protein